LTSPYKKTIAIVSLIIAGEIIFALPFHLARFFRPTLLEVLQLTPTQLGATQGIYGIIAMLSYFPGGFLADRFSTHKLLAISLWMTALGGLFLASSPNYYESLFLFAFFGITTIMLFWGALIRATREWGGLHQQGVAFGLLEGGRGLLAVSLASLGVLLFEWSFPLGYDSASLAEKQSTFNIVIYSYTAITALTGVLVWLSLQQGPNLIKQHSLSQSYQSVSKHFNYVLRLPAVWWQATIVLCAYVGYKSIDHLSLYAVDVYGYDAIEAAKLVTLAAWMRPIVAVVTGLIADRFNPIKMLMLCFIVLLISNLYFSFSTPQFSLSGLLVTNVLITCTAVFALRALYFAVFQSYQLPINVTGTAVGVISVIGFLPDVFVLYVAGKFVDSYPGLQGHQFFFLFLACFSLAGMLASYKLKKYKK